MKTLIQPTMFVLFGLLIVAFSACHKNPEPTPDNSMATMKVPANFNWSMMEGHQFQVTTTGLSEGATLILYDLDGGILEKQRVFGGQAVFETQVRTAIDTLRLYAPETRMSKYFTVDQTHILFGSGSLKDFSLIESDYAMELTGADEDYLELDNGGAGSMIVSFPFTFSAWFKTSGAGPEDHDMVLVNIADPSVSNVYYGIFLERNGNGTKWKPAIRSRNGGALKTTKRNMNLADDTWHQVTGVYTADRKRILYVDGVQQATPAAKIDFNTDAVILSIGRWGDSSPKSYFNGLIDNVCVWNTALSEADVAAYYNALPTGNEAGLQGFYTFNQGTGNTIANQAAPGGYNAMNNGGTYYLVSAPVVDTDGDGVPDEEDDFPTDPDRAYLTIYPSGNNYYYHMYEDLWPGLGDYDFNDVVLKTKLHTYKNAQNNLVGGRVLSSVYWIGGGIPRGAGMEWFQSNGSASTLTYMPANAVTFTEPLNVVTDPLVSNAVQLFDQNIIQSLGESVDFEYTWDHTIGGNSLWVQVYIYRDRDHEIHMYGHPPTNAQDMALFQTGNDASLTSWNWNPGVSFNNPAAFYRTATNLPWGLEIVAEELRVVVEKTEIIDAYPQFRAWAESGGVQNPDWVNHPDLNLTFIPGE
jgi:LruC domain-containing protein